MKCYPFLFPLGLSFLLQLPNAVKMEMPRISVAGHWMARATCGTIGCRRGALRDRVFEGQTSSGFSFAGSAEGPPLPSPHWVSAQEWVRLFGWLLQGA
jgi:hypothetical protein